MENTSRFNSEQLYIAENQRVSGHLDQAIVEAQGGLNGITSEAYPSIVQNREKYAVLLGLTRVLQVAETTRANRRINPFSALEGYYRSTLLFSRILNNRTIRSTINDVVEDPRGNPCFYAPECDRDVANTAINTALLYGSEGRTKLQLQGEIILERVADTLPVDHPVRPLAFIEMCRSIVLRGGYVLQNDRVRMIEALENIACNKQDLDRVSTTAARVVFMARRLKDSSIEMKATRIYEDVVNDHPGYNDRLQREEQYWSKRTLRRILFTPSVPVLYVAKELRMQYVFQVLSMYTPLTS